MFILNLVNIIMPIFVRLLVNHAETVKNVWIKFVRKVDHVFEKHIVRRLFRVLLVKIIVILSLKRIRMREFHKALLPLLYSFYAYDLRT